MAEHPLIWKCAIIKRNRNKICGHHVLHTITTCLGLNIYQLPVSQVRADYLLGGYFSWGSFLGHCFSEKCSTTVSSYTNGAHGLFVKIKGVSCIYSSMLPGHSLSWLCNPFFVDINISRHFAHFLHLRNFTGSAIFSNFIKTWSHSTQMEYKPINEFCKPAWCQEIHFQIRNIFQI